MNSVALTFLIVNGLLVLALPKKNVLVPFIITVCYITIAQKISIGGIDFNVARILIPIMAMRFIIRGEFHLGKMIKLDRMMLLWVFSNTIMYILLWRTSDAVINRSGMMFDALGLYFLFRISIKTPEDVTRVLTQIAFICVPLMLFMLVEKKTGTNAFSFFGGVPVHSWVRDGKLRAQGPFRHAILAGTFGATLFPMMIVHYWKNNELCRQVIVGGTATFLIMFASASSGPFLSFIFVIISMMFWPLRYKMKNVRVIIVLYLIALDIYMKAPIWYLIAKISNITGGTGWHRSYLIDQAFRYFNEWWLMGTKVTAHWMPYHLPGTEQSDITNMFILQGVQGGLITMIIFILLIREAFTAVGRARLNYEKSGVDFQQMLCWSMGAALVGHVAAFFSVTYFDQSMIFFYLLIAMIGSMDFHADELFLKENSLNTGIT